MYGKTLVTSIFKNLLDYIYQSHLILYAVVFQKLPESIRKDNKWANFLQDIVENKFDKSLKRVVKECTQIVQQNNYNLVTVIRRLILVATERSGPYESIGLILTYLNKVSLPMIKEILERYTLEEGFQNIS